MLLELAVFGSTFYVGKRLIQDRPKRQTLMEAMQDRREAEKPRIHKRTLFIGAGAAILGGTLLLANANGLTPLLLTNRLIDLMSNSAYGPLLYLSAYAARPLILFPATLLTIAGGLLFGPVNGILYTIIGSNLSALLAYGIGKRLANPEKEVATDSDGENQKWQPLGPYMEKMQKNPFTTVLTMRFLFLPYDLVNYGAGALGLAWQPFLLATALGSLPGTVAFVLAGASIQGSTISGVPALNPATLAASGVIFVSSLAFSRYLAQRQQALGEPALA